MIVNWRVLAFISITIAVVGITSTIVSYAVTGGFVPIKYGVVIDAGSSHTKLYLYQWSASKHRGTGLVEQVKTCVPANEGGIAKTTHPEPGSIILPCLANLSHELDDPTQISNTKVAFAATAGMRVLELANPDRAKWILESIKNAITTRSGYASGDIKILPARDEGLFAWISVNYIMDRLTPETDEPDETIGILDMGGASMQIAYELVNGTSTFNETDVETTELRLYGIKRRVLALSDLCFGGDESRLRLLHLIVADQITKVNQGQTVLQFNNPCLNDGATQVYDGADFLATPCLRRKTNAPEFKPELKYSFIGSYDPDLCQSYLRRLVSHESCTKVEQYETCPHHVPLSPPKNMHFLAMAVYYYAMRNLNLNENNQITYDEYVKGREELCGSSVESILNNTDKWTYVVERYAGLYCMALHYIEAVLLERYGFSKESWAAISFQKRVKEADIGWSLGYMINATNAIPEKRPSEPVISQSQMVALVIICSSLFALGIVLWGKAIKTQPPREPDIEHEPEVRMPFRMSVAPAPRATNGR